MQPANFEEMLNKLETVQQQLLEQQALAAQHEALIAEQQVRLHQLESRPPAAPQSKPTSRRRMVGKLVAGMLGGLAAGGAMGLVNPPAAQAGFIAHKGAGAILVPPGGTITGTLPQGATYGLVASSETSSDLSSVIDNHSGVLGISTFDDGVVGQSTSGDGVIGVSISGIGIQGQSTSGAGVFGTSLTGPAGAFVGKVNVTGDLRVGSDLDIRGNLSKGGGSFKIDHPLDPANQYLYHSFVESPTMMNIYNGLVELDEQGEGIVEMPSWFGELNSDYRYQLTSLGVASPNLHISEKLSELRFKIAGGVAGQEVSWQLTGIRQDAWAKAHRIPVEEVKPEQEQGRYLHPELYGQSPEKAVHHPIIKAF